jgi:hypothetical protein
MRHECAGDYCAHSGQHSHLKWEWVQPVREEADEVASLKLDQV